MDWTVFRGVSGTSIVVNQMVFDGFVGESVIFS